MPSEGFQGETPSLLFSWLVIVANSVWHFLVCGNRSLKSCLVISGWAGIAGLPLWARRP